MKIDEPVTTGRGFFRCPRCLFRYWHRKPHQVRISGPLERYYHFEDCPGWRP